MPPLNQVSLAELPAEIPVPRYDRSTVRTGIVHLGVGGFHRAHQAVYLDDLMNRARALDWGICGVGVLPQDARMRDNPPGVRRPVHAGAQGSGRDLDAPRHRLDRRLSAGSGRPGGGHREDGRPGDPDRLADGDRGRVQRPPGDRRIRRAQSGRPGRSGGGGGTRDEFRAGERGVAASAGPRYRPVHGQFLR
jgi:hypothetical protein